MITLSAAREIASEWHGGQGSALYALSSSGTITPGVEWEVGAVLRDCEHTIEQRSELEGLRDFAGNHYDVVLGRAMDAAKQDLTLIREQLVHAAPDSVLCDGTYYDPPWRALTGGGRVWEMGNNDASNHYAETLDDGIEELDIRWADGKLRASRKGTSMASHSCDGA